MKKYNYAAIILAALLLAVGISYIYSSLQWAKSRKHYMINDSTMQTKVKDIRDSAGREIVVYKVEAMRTNDLLGLATAQGQRLQSDLDKAKLKKKNVRSSVELDVNTEGSVSLEIGDSLLVKDDSGEIDTGLVVIPFSDSTDEFLKLKGTADFHPIAKGFVFRGLKFDYGIKDTFTVTHVLTGSVFTGEGMNVMVTTANKHSTIENVKSIYVPVEKKWFEKWYIHAGAGVVVGIFIASKL
jgi:hypothetical protein